MKRIELWHDTDTAPSRPVWCVSVVEGGEEIDRLAAHEQYAPALQMAKTFASKRGMDLVARDELGNLVEIGQDAEAFDRQLEQDAHNGRLDAIYARLKGENSHGITE